MSEQKHFTENVVPGMWSLVGLAAGTVILHGDALLAGICAFAAAFAAAYLIVRGDPGHRAHGCMAAGALLLLIALGSPF